MHRFDEVLAVAEQKGLQPKRLRYFGDERRCGGPRQTYISHLKPNINGRSGISPVDHPWLLGRMGNVGVMLMNDFYYCVIPWEANL